LALCWFGPLPQLSAAMFSAHMALHMGVVAVASPLLALGLRGERFDPVLRAPQFWPPIFASLVELIAVWAWHAPRLHHLARSSRLGFALEQATFLATGLYLWLAALGGDPERRAERRGQASLALLLTSMHMTLLGALLALPPRALYVRAHEHAAHAQALLSPLDDQHLGGAIMLCVGGLAYLIGGLALAVELLNVHKRARSLS
jgi:putative membrane protein